MTVMKNELDAPLVTTISAENVTRSMMWRPTPQSRVNLTGAQMSAKILKLKARYIESTPWARSVGASKATPTSAALARPTRAAARNHSTRTRGEYSSVITPETRVGDYSRIRTARAASAYRESYSARSSAAPVEEMLEPATARLMATARKSSASSAGLISSARRPPRRV